MYTCIAIKPKLVFFSLFFLFLFSSFNFFFSVSANITCYSIDTHEFDPAVAKAEVTYSSPVLLV